MELIKDLPAIFEEFADAKKNNFIKIKNLKEKGIPVVGSYCTYFPKEVAMAFGAAPLSLCSMSDATISEAEKDLPKNLCPLIKSSYGFAKADGCPYFYFSDVVVGETTCDGKKKMYELMRDFKDVYIMELPQSQGEEARTYWRNEVKKLKEYLENKFEVTITDEDLENAIKTENKARKALQRFSDLMKNDPCPISGDNLFKVASGTSFKPDRSVIPEEVNSLSNQIEEDYKNGIMQEKKPRIIITGCPMGAATEKLVHAVENHGGIVVGFENCSGAKQYANLVEENTGDPLGAIADRYLKIGCSVMTPNDNRKELLGSMIKEYKADGVIDMTLTACHTYNVESRPLGKWVKEQYQIPFLQIETDYGKSDTEQMNTRVEAFIEML